MKNLIIIVILLINFSGFSQSVFSEDKIDDMTGTKILKTKWITLKTEFKLSNSRTFYLRICQIDNLRYLDIKVITGNVVSIPKEGLLILKLNDGTLLNLKNTEYKITGTGDGSINIFGSEALGINPKYQINNDEFEAFLSQKIVKARIYLSDSYLEIEISSENSSKIQQYLSELKSRSK